MLLGYDHGFHLLSTQNNPYRDIIDRGDFMQWLFDEIKAIPYIVGGMALLFVGMLISDSVTSTADRIWKRKNR